MHTRYHVDFSRARPAKLHQNVHCYSEMSEMSQGEYILLHLYMILGAYANKISSEYLHLKL